jgi:hypothetical protein
MARYSPNVNPILQFVFAFVAALATLRARRADKVVAIPFRTRRMVLPAIVAAFATPLP